MKYRVRITQVSSGRFIANCDEPKCSAGAPTKEEAAAKVRDEIQYMMEFCPCSSVKEGEIEIEVVP